MAAGCSCSCSSVKCFSTVWRRCWSGWLESVWVRYGSWLVRGGWTSHNTPLSQGIISTVWCYRVTLAWTGRPVGEGLVRGW
jgi:hypothetical protein